MFKVCILLLAVTAVALSERVDYTGHKVLRVTPKSQDHSELLHKLRNEYNIDFWNEPHVSDIPVLFRLRPDIIKTVENTLTKNGMEYDIVFSDLQSVIEAERAMIAPRRIARQAVSMDFTKYHTLSDIYSFLKTLAAQYPNIIRVIPIGTSYEGRPIYDLKIGSNNSKPAIMIDAGMNGREWISVSFALYFVYRLVTTYHTDPDVKSLVDANEINIIPVANPDGYEYTWNVDRMWRKTRSAYADHFCRGADVNRNFDVQFCGIGSSGTPCEGNFCGISVFSEIEARTLRDMMQSLERRFKAYFSIHSGSQLWMTPYGFKKELPPNYSELRRVGEAGVAALAKKYDTKYRVGSIANVTEPVSGTSVDYAYVKMGVKMSFALDLRKSGLFGFLLPRIYILPICKETYDGLVAAIQAVQYTLPA